MKIQNFEENCWKWPNICFIYEKWSKIDWTGRYKNLVKIFTKKSEFHCRSSLFYIFRRFLKISYISTGITFTVWNWAWICQCPGSSVPWILIFRRIPTWGGSWNCSKYEMWYFKIISDESNFAIIDGLNSKFDAIFVSKPSGCYLADSLVSCLEDVDELFLILIFSLAIMSTMTTSQR